MPGQRSSVLQFLSLLPDGAKMRPCPPALHSQSTQDSAYQNQLLRLLIGHQCLLLWTLRHRRRGLPDWLLRTDVLSIMLYIPLDLTSIDPGPGLTLASLCSVSSDANVLSEARFPPGEQTVKAPSRGGGGLNVRRNEMMALRLDALAGRRLARRAAERQQDALRRVYGVHQSCGWWNLLRFYQVSVSEFPRSNEYLK